MMLDSMAPHIRTFIYGSGEKNVISTAATASTPLIRAYSVITERRKELLRRNLPDRLKACPAPHRRTGVAAGTDSIQYSALDLVVMRLSS